MDINTVIGIVAALLTAIGVIIAFLQLRKSTPPPKKGNYVKIKGGQRNEIEQDINGVEDGINDVSLTNSNDNKLKQRQKK